MTRIVSNGQGNSAAFVLLALLYAGSSSAASDIEIRGSAVIEQRYFLQDALYDEQDRANFSVYGEAEIYKAFNDGDDSISFKPFYRIDQNDDERTHGDIRELIWLHVGDSWEMRTGIGKVFWGQTESLHLVDVINQTDSIEAIDGEDKLGQPMVNFSLIKDWGTTSIFVLPYFRERTFAGLDGRPRFALNVDTDNPIFESSDEEKNVDWAARWQHSIGIWEIGLSYFDGTSREPILVPELDEESALLRPYYPQMQQAGIDLLAVMGSWLIKFEGISRNTTAEDYSALVGGFEYTTVGVFDSQFDLGWLMEYQYDGRDNTLLTPSQNDLMLGTRVVYNDIDGTEILFGIIQDLDESNSRSGFIEASSRISDSWKWRLDAWFFSSNSPEEPIYQYRRDDFVQLSMEFYF
ncbi:hypothetical protein Q4567_04640 [Aliiglaciecola sp. 2_MG-2023]|uniref:hypothetical protein n=1 Tax=unclassified Aliiglaciecola TaxID=2593648 RepID=UPI0026E27CB2|nr:MULTISPECIES: hypothetical protein [unclassified Aliiglaciecola]MDO6710004.1 hypothetical protein [Aliiglaciecola sp. 2_MG-2023]MDO6751152.1 hypothetical protein [Aliiglaciecola sp. 1_MG-2023]